MTSVMTDRSNTCQSASLDEYSRLESGEILYFPSTPFEIDEQDRRFLLGQKQSGDSLHKNISYRPGSDLLRAVEAVDRDEFEQMHQVMRRYSRRAVAFMASFLERYSASWKLDYASFRPIEESGRKVAHHARNDLIHVDSFGSRPSHGNRLLRVFTNIHPEKARVWITSDRFAELAREHAAGAGLPKPPHLWSKIRGQALGAMAGLGLPVVNRPEYDRFMRRFHHYMKDNQSFQRECRKERWNFPPGSTWIVFTDTASHACLTGQFALEQTFIVNRESLAFPERAPIAILERMVGFPLLPQPKG